MNKTSTILKLLHLMLIFCDLLQFGIPSSIEHLKGVVLPAAFKC